MTKPYTLHRGDCLAVMRTMADNSVDSIVTDPPYELTGARPGGRSPATEGKVMKGFMGMAWDGSGIAYNVDMWREALRVLKPGGYLLAFSGSRTYHRMACAIEDAGFDIRDQIMWVYSTGFPKSMNLDRLRGKDICGCSEGAESPAKRDLRSLLDSHVSKAWSNGSKCGEVLQPSVSEQGAHSPMQGREPSKGKQGRQQSSLEGRSDDLQEEGQLQKRALPARAGLGQADGAEGRLPDGAPSDHGGMVRLPANADGGGSSRRPRSDEERADEPGTVAGQSESQAVGAWPNCEGCGLPVVPAGLGTALKPAHEPICVARKPLAKGLTVAANVLAHGTGALNIDGCRVAPTGESRERSGEASQEKRYTEAGGTNLAAKPGVRGGDPDGRWPANIIHDGSAEVVALFPALAGASAPVRGTEASAASVGRVTGERERVAGAFHADSGSAARFFYCAKASRTDRNEGLSSSAAPAVATGATMRENEDADWSARNGNYHPTVKPTDLIAYLCRLVTPPGGKVLDMFFGSGSTGKACMREGFEFVGIDKDEDENGKPLGYLEIAEARIAFELARVTAANTPPPPAPQMDLFAGEANAA